MTSQLSKNHRKLCKTMDFWGIPREGLHLFCIFLEATSCSWLRAITICLPHPDLATLLTIMLLVRCYLGAWKFFSAVIAQNLNNSFSSKNEPPATHRSMTSSSCFDISSIETVFGQLTGMIARMKNVAFELGFNQSYSSVLCVLQSCSNQCVYEWVR